ncbi:hypothetical protein [Alicyclobacillus sp. SO9]|uniref:hypothetical protein n=1 Tax=Alicyclobacillus sp. SO9 TaxID=2665646 RepID=UPI0018E7865E|nr:hypothetical protein [Alicyclobacillus sp. SO9]QQE78476.1 hypothetical protein GI364_21820 [Alicyclobacillus sp. SO9]
MALHKLDRLFRFSVPLLHRPRIEVIRAFYCPNRMMAEAILTPSGLADLVRATLDGNILRMRFDKKMPHSILRSKYTVALIGQILTNPDWNERWKQVWHNRPSNNDAGCTVPLTCEPPHLAGSRWTTLGYSSGTLSFVLRIVRTESSTSFPFTKIWFSHPNSVKHGEFHVGSSKGGHSSSPSNREVQIPREPTSPTAITQPVMLGTDISQHFNVSNMEVHELGMKPRSGIGKNGAQENVTRYRKVGKSESREVSFYEEGGQGFLPAGEFTPFRGLEESSVPDSMLPFFRAIDGMTFQRGYDVGFIIERIPKESPISRTLDEADRLYAVVAIHSMNRKVYILEVDGRDGHSMSTLLYAQFHAPKAPLQTAVRLLNESITPQGAWDRASITALMENHYVLARHRRSDSWAWGQRLARKVNRLLTRID